MSGQATNTLNFVITPGVQLANLSHPNIAPNFYTGDSYQYTITGPPNQPVYLVQNGGNPGFFGNTDANGVLVVTGSDQSGSQGTYTQTWSVGGQQASPAFSFVVGDTNAGGTLVATSVGATPDSSVVGVSSISIANGTVTTYSATEMSANASLYYDVETVGTLSQDGTAIQQAGDFENGIAGGNLTTASVQWSDFSLQTDHYAVAYFVDGGGYDNPYYYQSGACDSGDSDCTYWPADGAYYITAASIYLGSTVAGQMAVPTDGTVANNDLDANYVTSSLPGRTPPTGGWASFVVKWGDRVAAAYAASQIARSHQSNIRFPAYLKVYGDCLTRNQAGQTAGLASRERDYRLMDIDGNAWPNNEPILIKETITTWTATENVTGGGVWGTSPTGANDSISSGGFDDTLEQRGVPTAPQGYFQQFYATGFNASGAVFSAIPGLGALAVPLYVRDNLSTVRPGAFATLADEVHRDYVSINSDGGNAPNIQYTLFAGEPTNPHSCGGP